MREITARNPNILFVNSSYPSTDQIFARDHPAAPPLPTPSRHVALNTAVSALRYQRVISAVNLLVLASWSHSPIGSEWRPGEVHHTALPAAPGFYENRFSFSASISSMDRPAVSGIHFQSMMKAMTLMTPKIP